MGLMVTEMTGPNDVRGGSGAWGGRRVVGGWLSVLRRGMCSTPLCSARPGWRQRLSPRLEPTGTVEMRGFCGSCGEVLSLFLWARQFPRGATNRRVMAAVTGRVDVCVYVPLCLSVSQSDSVC